jgi:hypothetical protein
MQRIETRPLFTMHMKVESQPLGATHGAERRVVIVSECITDGDRIRGRVPPGGQIGFHSRRMRRCGLYDGSPQSNIVG